MYLNKVLLYGNLTRDPEKKSLPSGMNVCNFSVATNRVWNDRDGKKQESTEFHNVVVFGKQADVVAQYLKKGSGIFVEGRLQTRSWEDNGKKQYRTEVIADRIQFGPRRDGQGGDSSYGGGESSYGSRSKSSDEQEMPPLDTIQYPEEDINPDDIPF